MMAVNIGNLLANNNVESYICTTRQEGELKNKISKNVKYYYLKKTFLFDFGAVIRLKNYIQQNDIEIIHAHSSSYFIATLVKFLCPKVILIWHDHYGKSENLPSRKLQPLKFFSKLFDSILSVNSNLVHWAKEKLEFENSSYIPNFPMFSKVEKVTKLKGLTGKRIICLAGFRPQKDHLNLLKSFKIVSKSEADWSLHLVGNQYDDGYIEKVLLYIETEQLKEKVLLYHNCTDVAHVLSQSDIGVLSSVSEGLPVALLEYGLVGLPVVCTDVGQCTEVLNGGEYGWVVPPKSPKDLADAIKIAISDSALANSKSEGLKEYISNNYSSDVFQKKYFELIYNLQKEYSS